MGPLGRYRYKNPSQSPLPKSIHEILVDEAKNNQTYPINQFRLVWLNQKSSSLWPDSRIKITQTKSYALPE